MTSESDPFNCRRTAGGCRTPITCGHMGACGHESDQSHQITQLKAEVERLRLTVASQYRRIDEQNKTINLLYDERYLLSPDYGEQ